MIFAAPLWLIGLAPLAAVVVYLLWGRRRQEAVPFLDLWRGPVKGPRPSRQFTAPPLALALAILAMLLAVLGAARPALWDPLGAAPITIIVDRGATMSAGDAYLTTSQAAQGELSRLGAATPVDLLVVPGSGPERTDVGRWVSRMTGLPPTAADTEAALRATVARRLAETAGPVLVLSDRDLRNNNDRIVQISPLREPRNVGIVHLAARQSPRAQVMVRLRANRQGGRTELKVSTGGRQVVREVDLPAGGETRDEFVDFETLGDVVKAELQAADNFAGDNAAWLVREASPPRIEPRGALPPELRRMIDVYASSRPPAAESPRVAVVRDPAALPAAAAGVVVAEARDLVAAADVQVRPHAVTRQTRWSFSGPIRLAAPPPGDWKPVLSFGGRTAVAVREGPARQVWVGIESEQWPRTPEYVVFWANVFDWLGGGDVRFHGHAVGRLEGAWEPVELAGGKPSTARPHAREEPGLWPGLYRRADDGALRAVNAGDITFPAPPAGDWRPRLAQVLSAHARGAARPLSAGLLLSAGGCAALAAAAWKGSVTL